MSITEIQKGNKIVKQTKRLGRGIGSGKGGKAGRGQKGYKSRTGSSVPGVFEGGQTPFIQKIPKKRGFTPISKIVYQTVNISQLDPHFADGATVTLSSLVEKGLFRGGRYKMKILATGKITKKLSVEAHAMSKSAKEKIEKAGGSVMIVS